MQLETERLILRRFAEADADFVHALDNDPQVMRYINGGTPTPMNIIREKILPVFMRCDEGAPGFGFWLALARETAVPLGWFCLRLLPDDSAGASLGYRLCRDAWGKGYATEGARVLVDRGFGQLGLTRIVATTYEYNAASRRVMEKLGMELVRTFRVDLATQETAHFASTEVWDGDDVEYALTRADWARRQAVNSSLE